MTEFNMLAELLGNYRKTVCVNCKTRPCKPNIVTEWVKGVYCLFCKNYSTDRAVKMGEK